MLPVIKKKSSSFYAAVDLGSNSFHMIVADAEGNELKVIDRLRSMVRLASGLTKDNYLEGDVVQLALDTLANFGQRLRNIPAKNIRIVGTNTLRQAKNSKQFIKSAEKLLGHPIEIISGREEARLVYLGAAHSLGGPSGKRLVIDIGGGSTELVIGEGFEAEIMESIWAGCVSASKNWFAV
jgi:exopolyphosphatase/guanosine-5'-triphosphate,3'-diphosphate pyrophosphatase